MEAGHWHPTDEGTPQGGNLSPLLANLYLHYVLDLWWERKVQLTVGGTCKMVRYADDSICMVPHRQDAERLERLLHERFAKFGLTLHPDKTRTISLGRSEREKARREGRKPDTFDFYGVSGNFRMIQKFGYVVIRAVQKWLNRRSQRRNFTWKRRNDYLEHYPLPRPRIVYRMYQLLPLWETDRRAGCGQSARPVL
jgi:RNA-directed DNA polymerase